MKILLGTTNYGKISEMTEIIKSYFPNWEILTLNDVEKIPEPCENEKTFNGNAIIKAQYYYNYFKMPIISDDSGLCVMALNGNPGVNSARYAGEGARQMDLINKLLINMKDIDNRVAQFISAVVFFNGTHLITGQGIVNGSIGYEVIGNQGFGYDPVFIPDGYSISFAQMAEKSKNQLSHRHLALRDLFNQLSDYFEK